MALVDGQSKHRQTFKQVTGRAEMKRDRGVVAESNLSEVFSKPVSQAAPRLANVQSRSERTEDAVDYVARVARE